MRIFFDLEFQLFFWKADPLPLPTAYTANVLLPDWTVLHVQDAEQDTRPCERDGRRQVLRNLSRSDGGTPGQRDAAVWARVPR